MNKVRILGAIILLIGIAGDFLLDTVINGFWIGATMGLGGGLLIVGRIKKR